VRKNFTPSLRPAVPFHRGGREREYMVAQPEAARRMGVTTRTLHRWRRAGLITAHVVQGRVYFRLDDIQAFLAKHREEPPL